MKVVEIAQTNTSGINLDELHTMTIDDVKNTSNLIGNPVLSNPDSIEYSLYKRITAGYIEYFLCSTTDVICMVGASLQNTRTASYIQIHGVQIKPTYKSKGLGLLTYDSIKNVEKMNLMSDCEQTLDGKKLWHRIASVYNVAVINMTTGNKISNDIDDAYQLYFTNEPSANNTVLVTEEYISEGILVKKINVNRRKNGNSI